MPATRRNEVCVLVRAFDYVGRSCRTFASEATNEVVLVLSRMELNNVVLPEQEEDTSVVTVYRKKKTTSGVRRL